MSQRGLSPDPGELPDVHGTVREMSHLRPLIVLGLLFSSGCGLAKQTVFSVGSKVADSKELDNRASPQDSLMLHGFVERRPGDIAHNALVSASTQDGTMVAAVSVGELGYYTLFVPSGTYFLTAYVDRNDDGKFTPDEMTGQSRSTLTLSQPRTNTYFGGVDLELSSTPEHQDPTLRRLLDEPLGLELPPPSLAPLGSLTSARLGRDNVALGVFESSSAFFSTIAPLQFLEEIDWTTDRIPLVLVHGIDDSPQIFQALLKYVDLDRYEPLFFYYPTGARLASSAYLLFQLTLSGEAMPSRSNLAMLAHSMGGLVARGGLNLLNQAEHGSQVLVYGSFVSPYGGVDMANFGIKTGPVIVPSWIDVASKSSYVQHLFDLRLDTRFLMANGNGKGNSDGVIALSSQRRGEALAQAYNTKIYPQTHVGIMSDQHALSDMLHYLDETIGSLGKQSHAEATPSLGASVREPGDVGQSQSDSIEVEESCAQVAERPNSTTRIQRMKKLQGVLFKKLSQAGLDVLVSTITHTVTRLRVQNSDFSTVLQLSVGENVALDAPDTEHSLMRVPWPPDSQLDQVANGIILQARQQLKEAPQPRGQPAIPRDLRNDGTKSPSVQLEKRKEDNSQGDKHEMPPPVVLATGLFATCPWNEFRPSVQVPLRFDGYLGHFGLGSELRYTVYSSPIPRDGYRLSLSPVVIAGGPRLRFGHESSLLSLALGLNGGVEMGRGAFYSGEAGDSVRGETVVKHVFVTNALAYAMASVGLRIHGDFYGFLSADSGLRIPEKTFSPTQDSEVKFVTRPFSSLAIGVEVRIP